MNFLKANSITPSGGVNPAFFGSKKRLMELYVSHCASNAQKPLNRRFFLKRVRWLAHVQIRKGDQFVDALWIRLNQVRAQLRDLESRQLGIPTQNGTND